MKVGHAGVPYRVRLALLLVLSAVTASGSVSGAAPLTIQKVADGVYAHQGQQADASADNGGDIANLGFIVGERCVAVVDTGGTRALGLALLAAIRTVTPKPICVVVNTHAHPDHLFGNSAFTDDGIAFVTHAKFPAALAARRDGFLRSLERTFGAAASDTTAVEPTESVALDRVIDLGNRRIALHAWPTAHTDNDLTVLDIQSGTLFTGDLLFVDRIPVVDGKLLGWLKVIDVLRASKPEHLVPGHGPIDAPLAVFDSEQRYLNRLAVDTRRELQAGHTLATAIENVGLEERTRWLLFDDYHRRNATAAYTELEWED